VKLYQSGPYVQRKDGQQIGQDRPTQQESRSYRELNQEEVRVDIFAKGIEDDLGPTKVLWLREPKAPLEAFIVVDNVACGPALGGVRMAPDVTLSEVARLARAMTFKNAAAGLPHGGAKAGIVADPSMPVAAKEQLMRAFAKGIQDFKSYIPGPDIGLNEECMAWIHDEIRRAAGLPRVLGGIPLDEIGATGYGLTIAAEVAAPLAGIELRGSRVAVQGFGAVGIHAARFLARLGAKLVAASDSQGAIINRDGLPVDDLISHKRRGKPLIAFPHGKAIPSEGLVSVDCDIWIPAARPDVLNKDNVAELKARMVLQGANIPATDDAETWMHANNVLCVPDFIANAGGVICASVEYHGGSETQAMATIEEKVRRNTEEVLNQARARKCTPRQAAIDMARSRVQEAMKFRR
jgi:glutamate dehydrogenase/leucine dehydrogenase